MPTPAPPANEDPPSDNDIRCDYAWFHDTNQIELIRRVLLIIGSEESPFADPLSGAPLTPGPVEMYSATIGPDTLIFFGYPQIEILKRATSALQTTCDWLYVSDLGDPIGLFGYGHFSNGAVDPFMWCGETKKQMGVSPELRIRNPDDFLSMISMHYVPPTLLWSFGKVRDEDWFQEVDERAGPHDKLANTFGLVWTPSRFSLSFRGDWVPVDQLRVRETVASLTHGSIAR